MKIAYLMHSDRGYEELVETLNQLTKQGDHVFIMINDNDLREQIQFVYMDYSKVHISHTQEFAQEGDLSMARGTLIQMKEALHLDTTFDYFINLNDGMLPIKSRNEIVNFLEQNKGTDFYYVDASEKEEPELRKQVLKYYPFTNLLAFPHGKFTRAITKGFASLLSFLHIRRTLEDEIMIGSPWFMLSNESATLLAENFAYCSTTYKLSWYAEELYIPMMLKKFGNPSIPHINKDYRVSGEGTWVRSQNTRPTSFEAIEKHAEALFAGSITSDNISLYERYFDIYNENLEGETPVYPLHNSSKQES